MPEFHLDTSGQVDRGPELSPGLIRFGDLDSFTQGYIEALFFTENEPGLSRYDDGFRAAYPQEEGDETDDETAEDEYWSRVREGEIKEIPGDYGFADLAPEALAQIIADCREFRETAAWKALLEALGNEELGDLESDIAAKHCDPVPDTQAGRDFWYTRNGHGCGFWDGDWPEPYATQLTEAAEAFGEVSVCIGDDGKVHL